MPVETTETHRGPSVLLNYVFREEEESDKVVIDNLVAINAKVVYSSDQFYISYTTLDTEENVKIVLKVTSENPSFDRKYICTENESDWLEIGVISDSAIIEKDRTVTYNVKINVSARKIEKPALGTQMFLDADFIDFNLSAVDGSVAVHKIVLASHSDVFKAMLTGAWKENEECRVEVTGTTRQSLDHLKDYMYLDILPDEGLRPLLLLARYYMIGNLKTGCIGKLTDSVTSDNLHELLDFACANNIPELTYEILYNTTSEVVDKAYKLRKETKTKKLKVNETK